MRGAREQESELPYIGASVEMPRYKCHKEVWALKIRSVTPVSEDGSAELVPEERGYGPVKVDRDYMSKHRPSPGGYYVVYKDGYRSFSPADAFEEGYSAMPQR